MVTQQDDVALVAVVVGVLLRLHHVLAPKLQGQRRHLAATNEAYGKAMQGCAGNETKSETPHEVEEWVNAEMRHTSLMHPTHAARITLPDLIILDRCCTRRDSMGSFLSRATLAVCANRNH